MQLYKKSMSEGMRNRPIKTLNLSIEERPERPVPMIRTNRERVKYIKKVESVVRSSMEYKDYMRFLKEHMNMRRCTVLKGLKVEHGKHYSIDIHHEPFTLFDIVETFLNYHDLNDEPYNTLKLADEVMEIHYNDMVGLIPLSKTMHELAHADKIFIPLQYVYQDYAKFFAKYEDYISPITKEKIEAKVNCSLKCDEILSDVLDPEFTYVHIDGFDFPSIPDSWKDIMSMDRSELQTEKLEVDK